MQTSICAEACMHACGVCQYMHSHSEACLSLSWYVSQLRLRRVHTLSSCRLNLSLGVGAFQTLAVSRMTVLQCILSRACQSLLCGCLQPKHRPPLFRAASLPLNLWLSANVQVLVLAVGLATEQLCLTCRSACRQSCACVCACMHICCTA